MNEEEPKAYQVIDKRRVSVESAATQLRPLSEKAFQDLCDKISDDGAGDEPDHGFVGIPGGVVEFSTKGNVLHPAAELVAERAPEPLPTETRKPNRRERLAIEKRAKKDAKAIYKKKMTMRAHSGAEEGEDTSPLDPIEFMGVVGNEMNHATARIERARARVLASDRMMADELQMSLQLAFCLGYLDAYGPSAEEDRLRLIGLAQHFKKSFKFRTQEGEIVTPKPTPAIQQLGPSIILP